MKYASESKNDSNMGRTVSRRLGQLVVCGVLAFAGAASAATYSYKMAVVASLPTGSAGATSVATRPTNTKMTPCSTAKPDAVAFTVTYDAGKVAADLKDVYLILYNPNDAGPFYTLKKNTLVAGPSLTARADVAALNTNKATDIYVATTSNLGAGSTSENVLGSSIPVDGVTSGTWQLVGIIADKASVDFDDPSTWAAWDVATVVFGKPWKGAKAGATTCTDVIP